MSKKNLWQTYFFSDLVCPWQLSLMRFDWKYSEAFFAKFLWCLSKTFHFFELSCLSGDRV